jgi:hypothetical protein
MNAVRLTLTAADLPDSLAKIRSKIEAAVPVGFNQHESDKVRGSAHAGTARVPHEPHRSQAPLQSLRFGAQTQGIECRKDGGVIDEIPAAYKDIDEVMANQTDLVEPLHTLRQVICVKVDLSLAALTGGGLRPLRPILPKCFARIVDRIAWRTEHHRRTRRGVVGLPLG